ncbi:MAG TPA: hypothetical protein VMW83_15125 [Spirochaetia bacterium]|nr:hypothetical protein [Spirochaetia bacterium]
MEKNEIYWQHISKLKSLVTLETVIAGILAYLQEDVTIDPVAFTNAIEELSRSHSSWRYHDKLSSLDFSTSGGCRYSRQLASALFKLGCSEIPGVVNPQYGRYVVDTKAKEKIKAVLNTVFSEDDKAVLEEMSMMVNTYLQDYAQRSS